MPARFPDTAVSRDARSQMNGNDRWNKDDDVVISGISGRFPESSSVEEFKQQLFDGVDLITADDRRYTPGIYGMPQRTGKLKDLKHFDATFFGVHAKQAECMDPQIRLLLELTQEAIIDAGINPNDIRGSKTGVFVGICSGEAEEFWTQDPDVVNGYGLIGCCRSMASNRISYCFDFNGPSFTLDTACSSSMYALHQANMAIRNGECDSAIVAGVNLVLKPCSTLQFHRLGMLSMEGKCKAFDSDPTGYVRSEACVVIFLQKSSSARRVYSTLVATKTNIDGNKQEGITYPSGQMQGKLIREVYSEVNVDPSEVAYVETHGTGTKVGDPQEVNTIAEIFCKNRKEPLLIGSVKSNMGHSEPVSGLCQLAKIIIGMESGVMPQNLHFKGPNPNIPALTDGRLKVCSENTPFGGGYVALNSFGFGGANAHVLLKSYNKPKATPSLLNIPRLLTVSGRTQSAVNSFLDKLEECSNDEELLAMVYEIHKTNITGHNYRGYSMLGDQTTREVSEVGSEKRPIWFIYSGMGSQYTGMAKHMLKIDAFKAAIDKCSYVLKPHGMNLEEILLRAPETAFDDILNAFVGIAAVQVALTDCLLALGIQPDGIIGHSVGEIGCAYADGTFTAEQMILAAYARGRAIVESNLPAGAMAAVGLSWEECRRRCPPDIIPACHNSDTSVTISGPPESIRKFVEQLQAENIFAKAVRSAGRAFHSKYIMDASPKLKKSLDAIIPNPKPRSSRWISTSIPESAWNTQIAQLSSAAYHVNNLLSPVLFHEAVQHIPDNAIVIEIAPTCLLQAILKRSLKPDCTYIPLMKRDHENNLNFFMSNLGKLYNAGAQPKVMKLYQPISFPVGRGTKMIAPMVEWDHSMEWTVPSFAGKSSRSGESVVQVDLSKEEDAFIAGHTIDGRVLYPATGYLTLVWKAFAKLHNKDFEQMPVVLEDVSFHRATIMPKEGPVKFLISFLESSGEFELCEGGTVTVSGKIRVPEDPAKEMINLPLPEKPSHANLLDLAKEDIYSDLRLRGYDYYGLFQGIHESDNFGVCGKLQWEKNWISFMDTMLQFSILGKSSRLLYLPTRVQKVTINPQKHSEIISSELQEGECVPVYMYRNCNILRSGGIEIRGMKANLAPRRQHHSSPKLEKYVFISNENSQPLHEDFAKARHEILTVTLQLLIENSNNAIKVRVAEVAQDRPAEMLLGQEIFSILGVQPTVTAECTVVTTGPVEAYANLQSNGLKIVKKDMSNSKIDQKMHMVVGHDLLRNMQFDIINNALESLGEGGMLLLEEPASKTDKPALERLGLTVINEQVAENKKYLLLRKIKEIPVQRLVIAVTEKNYKWVDQIRSAMKQSETDGSTIFIVAENEPLNGVIGLINCLTREGGGEHIRCFFIQGKADKFSCDSAFYQAQMKKNMVHNVLKNGVWGTFRHLLLDQQNDSAKLQVEHAYVNTLTRGDLSSLRWIEGPLSYYKPKVGEEMCAVYYAPLNFRDIMLATGKLPADALPGNLATEECVMGLEFAGRDSKGRRIMALMDARTLATTAIAPPNFVWEVPEKWSLEEAASIPAAYATSYYSLVYRGRIQPGESILIHAGSGGVGQAAIAIALHMGCTVFTTVGTNAKREFIMERFPQIKSSHIGNSRDTSFEQMVMEQTNGRGVDLVLNSLAEDKLQASVRCLAEHGRFLEIGKVDLSNNSPLGMSIFLKNVTFHGILLDALFGENNEASRAVSQLVSEGIKNGAIRPLPTTVFSENQLEQAFRYMSTGKHIGKVMLKIRDEECRGPAKPAMKLIPAIPRTYLHPDKTYVLVGGLGGFGMELADWFIYRGATKIVLTSRSGVRTGYQSLCIRRWQERGVTIKVLTDDASTEEGAQRLLEKANQLGTVGGIFNLAAVLHDALMENQTEADFMAVGRPKVDATKNLDMVSRKLCPHLDYFVAFSSVSCGRGNIGQSNYGYANSVMERVCESRQAAGLPGLAIQWGAIGDVGLIQRMAGAVDAEVLGTVPQKMYSCLQTIDILMQQPHPVLGSLVLSDANKNKSGDSQVDILDAIANILGIKDSKTAPRNVTLADFGMDSIMGAEIKQTLERNYDLSLSAQEIRSLTFAKLEEHSGGATVPTEQPAQVDKTQVQYIWPEIMPTKALVQMKSKGGNQKDALFLVHPIEGVVNAMEELTMNLPMPVYGFQCTAAAPLDSITDLAAFYIKEMRAVQAKGPYTLCGYSFGACVAFEMALQLEDAGERVKLVLLDGSHSYVATHTGKRKSTQGNTSENESEALSYFILQFKEIDQNKVISELLNLKNWEARLTRTTEILAGTTPFSADQLKTAASSFYWKLVAADKYKPSTKFRGEITLLRAKNNYVQLGDDYGLTSVCKQKISIQALDGDHRSILVGNPAQKISSILQNVVTTV